MGVEGLERGQSKRQANSLCFVSQMGNNQFTKDKEPRLLGSKKYMMDEWRFEGIYIKSEPFPLI